MQVRSSMTIMPPEPIIEPASVSFSKSTGRSSRLSGHTAAGRSAGLHGLEGPVLEDAAADVEDDVPQGRAHGELDQAGILDLADQREGLGALGLVGSHRGEPVAPVGDDGADVGPGLDVVEHRRQVEEALVGGVHVLGARLADLAGDRQHQGRRLAADEGAAAAGDLEVEVEAGAQDVLAEQAEGARLLDGDDQG